MQFFNFPNHNNNNAGPVEGLINVSQDMMVVIGPLNRSMNIIENTHFFTATDYF